jgi:negative regulator of sigma E activity
MRLRLKYNVVDRDGERYAQVHSTRVQVGATKSNIQVDSLDTENELARRESNNPCQ